MVSIELFDFAYNRRCFLGTFKGILYRFKLQKVAFSAKKGAGICFEKAYATTKLVPRIFIAPQPMYPSATCRLGNCANMKLIYNNFSVHKPPAARRNYCSSPVPFLTHVSTSSVHVSPPQNRHPLFIAINAETGFLRFKA